MFFPGITISKLLFSSLVVAVILASIQLSHGKSVRSLGYSNLRSRDAIKIRRGGCAAFGHSCIGGHGKRTDAAVVQSGVDELRLGLRPPTNEEIKSPADFLGRDLQEGNVLNPLLPQQYHEKEDYLKLSPFFKKWLQAIRAREDLIPVNK